MIRGAAERLAVTLYLSFSFGRWYASYSLLLSPGPSIFEETWEFWGPIFTILSSYPPLCLFLVVQYFWKNNPQINKKQRLVWLDTPKYRLMKLISKGNEKTSHFTDFSSFTIAKCITVFLQTWNSSRRTIKQMHLRLKDPQQKDIFKLPSLLCVLSFWVISFTMSCETPVSNFHCPQIQDRRLCRTLHISDYLGALQA